MKTKKFITAILLGCTIGLGFYIYNLLTYKYINIEFGEMRPIHENVNIFYKGIKIGHVRKFEIAHHGQSTIAKSVITHKTLMLPVNTIAKFKKEKKHKKTPKKKIFFFFFLFPFFNKFFKRNSLKKSFYKITKKTK